MNACVAAAVAPRAAHGVLQIAAIDTATLMRGCRRFVVVSPHPDDEVLGVGGILANLASTATPMLLIAVTDGEASHAPGDWWTSARLRATRPRESLDALQRLGWPQPVVRRLRFADAGVGDAETALTSRLVDLLRADDCVATTWQHDGHPDHEATARAVLTAAAQLGCRCAQFPVWKRAEVLQGQTLVRPLRLRRFALDAEAVRRKHAALAVYNSQMRADPLSGAPSIVPMAMQEVFLRGTELLVL